MGPSPTGTIGVKYKAVQITAPGEMASVECMPVPLKDHEVRIEVAFCGICGTDLRVIADPAKTPLIPGHEFSGRVTEVGADMRGRFKTGDRVTAFSMVTCLKCAHCRKGDYRECEDKLGLGVHLPGAFAQEIITDGHFLIKLHDGITYEQGALIEHLSCGYRLTEEIVTKAGVTPSDATHIVVIGDGPIALADIQFLKAAGFSNIDLIGKHDNRKDMAKRLGAARVFDCGRIDEIGEILGPVDICIFATRAEAMLDPVIPLMKPSGIFFPQARVMDQRNFDLLKEKRVAIGRAFCYFMEDFDEVMKLILDGRVQADPLVTARVPLTEVADRYRDFYKKGNNIKILVENHFFQG